MKFRPFFFKLVSVFFSIIITIIILEFIFVYFKLSPQVFKIPIDQINAPFTQSSNPRLGYLYKKKFFDPKNPKIQLTNNFGMRDKERNLKKEMGQNRILILGDSVIDGNLSEALISGNEGIYDLNKTIPYYLETLFSTPNIEVLNFGINGYCTTSEVELLKEKGLSFSPDIVVMNFVENDYLNCFGMMYQAEKSRSIFLEYLFMHSALFRYVSLRLPELSFRKNIIFDPHKIDDFCFFKEICSFLKSEKIQKAPSEEYLNSDHFKLKSYFLMNIDMVKQTEEAQKKYNNLIFFNNAIEELSKLSEQYKFKVLITIWPSFKETSIVDVDYDNKVKKISEQLLIEKIAKHYRLPTIRLSPQFIEAYKSAKEDIGPNLYFTVGDEMHPNSRGSFIAAKAIKSIIDPLLHQKIINKSSK